jgi:hypothetical protein
VIELRPFLPEFDYHWMKQHVGCVLCEDTRGLIAVRNGVTVGGFIADSWTETSCQVHQAILDPLCLRTLPREFCRYVFMECDRKLMLGPTPSDNLKAQRINEKYGFRVVARFPDALKDGVDIIMYQMDRATCRFLTEEERHGRQVQRPQTFAA